MRQRFVFCRCSTIWLLGLLLVLTNGCSQYDTVVGPTQIPASSSNASTLNSAAARVHCTGEAFLMEIERQQFLLKGDRAHIRWEARGSTMFDCSDGSMPDGSVIGFGDVGIAVAPTGDSSKLRGKVLLEFLWAENGFRGGIRGTGPCVGGVCIIDAEVQASSVSGSKLRMLQQVTVDLNTSTVTNINVLNIVIDITGAG